MTWMQLGSIAAENREFVRQEREQEPRACPNDGEPLVRDPDGKLRCHYDGWTWRK